MSLKNLNKESINSLPPKKNYKRLFLFFTALVLLWFLLPQPEPSLPRSLPEDFELRNELSKMTLSQPSSALQNKDLEMAEFGKKLFYDPRFSKNGEISCSHCHDPKYQFTDKLPTAIGIGPSTRRTPSLLNLSSSHWFFWDGRSDSLAAQALGPIEHPNEHGFSRVGLARLIKEFYSAEYKSLFGKWPIAEALPEHATPRKSKIELSTKVGAYSLASLGTFSQMDQILVTSQRKRIAPSMELSIRGDFVPEPPSSWVTAWEALSKETQEAVQTVSSQFGIALAAYQKTITTKPSPFDLFAQKFLNTRNTHLSFNKEFQQKELLGLKLFIGPGNCTSCHAGANFTDQQFHNIGLPGRDQKTIDLGRAFGVLLALDSPFNCLGPYIPHQRESCLELPYLDPENLELVGAFKTPSLRNVAERPPYTHDGRFSSLKDMLNHYNELPGEPAVGHAEETLLPLDFTQEELEALEAFLVSLTGDVIDLPLQITDNQYPRAPKL